MRGNFDLKPGMENVDRWKWVLLDVDGVMIDVSRSFDRAVKLTAERFLRECGREIELDTSLIRKLREKGKFGDDYSLTEALVLVLNQEKQDEIISLYPDEAGLEWAEEKYGINLDSKRLRNFFEKLYLGDEKEGEAGDSSSGLWKIEKKIIETELLDRLKPYFSLGIITGRDRFEYKLAEEIIGYKFDNVLTRDFSLKPDPAALEKMVNGAPGVYIGDTENDRLFVQNYRELGNEFDFIKADQGERNVNRIIRSILSIVEK